MFRVAGAQIPVTADIERNVSTILRAIDFAAAERAQILLTPEGSLSGYRHDFDRAAAADGLAAVTASARQRGVGLALGTCFQEADGRCYNQLRFYSPAGQFLGFHAKILRCSSLGPTPDGELANFAGDLPLKTFELCGVRVGGLICNDVWANPQCTSMPDPHLTQQHAQAGARIIFHAVNGGRSASEWSRKVNWPFHESNLRMRAAAGKVWIVTADNCHPPDVPCSAPSGVVDPAGQWACQTPDRGERFFAHTIVLQGPQALRD